jgi:hypothetical protein
MGIKIPRGLIKTLQSANNLRNFWYSQKTENCLIIITRDLPVLKNEIEKLINS